MVAIVVHGNMRLGDNTLKNERLSLVNTNFRTKYQRIANCFRNAPVNYPQTMPDRKSVGIMVTNDTPTK